ncbi:MAG: exopolysaccharide biosynthesis protein [Bryobacterales bacterium]|nr:exopolysaccharide biosynthesis protein [Bryobacterales bacterium]
MDDGARSLKESVAMLRMAADSGTTDIVATPHADLEYTFSPEMIRLRVEELTAATGGVPRIYEGCDFHLTFDNIQDAVANPAKYTINHKRYLMVEFSDMIIFQNTGEIFDRMMAAGIVPVITHPERNQLLQQRMGTLEKWVANGCLIQLTAQSLLGRFGKTARRFSLELLDRGLAHFVASDAHDTKHRPPVLSDAYRWTVDHYSQGLAERLFVTNPRAAIEGHPLPEAGGEAAGRRRAWYQFWGARE